MRLPLRVLYIPKGPLMDWSDGPLRARVLDDLQALAHQRRAIFLKMDPDVVLGTGEPGNPDACEDLLGAQTQGLLSGRGWRFSLEQIQFRNTMVIDLSLSEDELLARMKQKTRYNLRLAEKKGVIVRPGIIADLPLLYHLYAETSVRDGFVIRDEAYYLKVWEEFMRAGLGEPLIADVDGTPVAAVMIFRFGQKAWYLYGMSRQLHRDKMPNVLLQWEAIRRAKYVGCQVYDLWGAPDEFTESDSLWGVYRFKQGLGGQVVRTLGAWDYPVGPGLYAFYTRILPRWLNWMRNRGRERTQRAVQSV
jgi:lipid II:glycine glycyltransferase (peptidoglycan interpeptide bridge formation enzyme)